MRITRILLLLYPLPSPAPLPILCSRLRRWRGFGCVLSGCGSLVRGRSRQPSVERSPCQLCLEKWNQRKKTPKSKGSGSVQHLTTDRDAVAAVVVVVVQLRGYEILYYLVVVHERRTMVSLRAMRISWRQSHEFKKKALGRVLFFRRRKDDATANLTSWLRIRSADLPFLDISS